MSRLARAVDAFMTSGQELVTDMVTGTPSLLAFYYEGHWYRVSVQPSTVEEIDEFFGAEDDRPANLDEVPE